MTIAATSTTITGNDSAGSGTQYDLWGGISVVLGEFLVVVVACDNITTTDGNTNDHTGIIAGSGCSGWTKVYEFTNGQGAANAGATVSMWVGGPTTSTSVSTTSVTLSASGVVKRAFILHGFSVGSGNSLKANAAVPATRADDGADSGSMTLGSLASAEHLWVRGIAAETNTDTGPTATSSWTDFGYSLQSSTTGGGAAANMAAAAEYIISTGTTATSDPTWTSVDQAAILAAFDEVVGGSPIRQIHLPFSSPILRRSSI